MNYFRSFPICRFWPVILALALASLCVPAAQNPFYLHSASSNEFLDATAPVGTNFQTASSGPVDRTNFVEVGTWAAAPSPFFFELTGVTDLQLWLGRRFTDPNGNSDNSGNTGTFIDLRAEI